MIEEKIPFSRSAYDTGKYLLETRNNLKARIICGDRLSTEGQHIIYLIRENNNEAYVACNEEGKTRPPGNYNNDLVLVKRTFENGDVVNLGDGLLGIFKESNNLANYFHIVSEHGKLTFNDSMHRHVDMRIATNEEVNNLRDILKNNNQFWNKNTKQVEGMKVQVKQWCLMRNGQYDLWKLCQFSNMDGESFTAIGGSTYEDCIPYTENTKYLLGTVDNYIEDE